MSKKKSGSTLAGWMSARSDCKEGRFIQVGNSLLLSEQFQALTAGAQMTYLYMTMESGGKREFIFPLSTAKKYGIAKNTLPRHVDELTKAGFISVRSGQSIRQPNEYAFSFDWKGGNDRTIKSISYGYI